MKRKIFLKLTFLFFLIYLSSCVLPSFKKNNIKLYIRNQLNYGPRLPGSNASRQTSNYFKEILEPIGWQVEFQDFEFDDIILRNIIAKNSSDPPELLIGAHYDTRQFSDQDPDKKRQAYPVPGAIDGASGSAIILEMGGKIFDSESSIWLVFFDGEDQGRINNWNWSIGAEYFVKKLVEKPKKVVILDMLGDEDLKVFLEKNSNFEIANEIWKTAEEIGYNRNFIYEKKYAMIDDHLPFINQGIPAVLIIDFDYPYWHTTMDTYDKVSGKNLDIVLSVMLNWIKSQ